MGVYGYTIFVLLHLNSPCLDMNCAAGNQLISNLLTLFWLEPVCNDVCTLYTLILIQFHIVSTKKNESSRRLNDQHL